jgi:hypothetical protein
MRGDTIGRHARAARNQAAAGCYGFGAGGGVVGFGCSTGAGVELGTVAPVGAAGAALLPEGGVV